MNNFTVPDICDEYENIQIGDLFLKSFGSKNKFYGQIQTVECEHSNSVVKELVEEKGEGKVLLINHTGDELCSMVGDQIAQKAFENNWTAIVTNGYIRDVEVIKKIDIGLYAMNAFPKKTNKLIGIGKKNISIRFGNTEINNGDWIYFDTNGWVISKAKLKF
ncbi:MAG: ribonuclease E inhibitor RraA [Gammaproteobacteria bacterium TMED225]|nr:MAG: ribonuclease E inhibitor RraA [Gammaproteobacteria bacterium TMED225]